MTKGPEQTGLYPTSGKGAGTSDRGLVSSPLATGGAGTFFEQHVSAYWLALLLVKGIPPILHGCAVVEVHLQTERLGWHTDDFLVVGENGSGDRRRLAGQVKQTFTVSATDSRFQKAVQDFWTDFNNRQQFSPASDRFALVTLRGTNTLLEHFAGLLECSRSARDGHEFQRMLATPGFLSSKVVGYCDEIRTVIGESEGKAVSAADLWPFLRVLHVLSLDLNTSPRQTEAAIQTLLAHTTTEQDAVGAAEASWNALLRLAGEGMPQARSFRRDDLPEALRRRHSQAGGNERRALRALSDHSELILNGIRSTIGNVLHLQRGQLVQHIVQQLESSQVIVISGPAGSGKSVIAKDVVRLLAADHFAFSFRAEEFVSAHLDETLQRNQIPCSARTLGAILAGQERKVLLVESAERLLEASTREAFADLLTLVAGDASWRLILTCREYSTPLIRTAFLEPAKLGHSVFPVPPLGDDDLEEVRTAYPTLGRPLANAALRQLLRNPFVMDKALRIDWSEQHSLPLSEREFRAQFWREVVRNETHSVGGMPQRREEAFVQVALRRARALTPYALCGDLDPEVLYVLQRDSVVVCSPDTSALVAPAHDVLEDWAILQWMDEQYAARQGSIRELCATIGTHPAVRRTYRKWVSELVERHPEAADRVFQAVILEEGLPPHARDDTLTSLLQSPASAEFLERHRARLFANDKRLLRRVIHLLRVACVTTPTWLSTTTANPSLFNVPEGPAWTCVLRLVQSNLGSFTSDDRTLLLGLIEDWAQGVSSQTPYPDGAESAAAIAYWLLPGFGHYRSEDQRKRTLRVIAKIPDADRDGFGALLRGVGSDRERARAAKEFREIIFGGWEGMPAARDIPDTIVSSAKDYLLCSEADLRREWDYRASLDLEPLFGLREGRDRGFLPASAYHGPFLPLLRYHPRQGLAFIIDVFNHSADWYAHPRVPEHLEPAFEVTLEFADGSSRTQWCNTRLWNLYRGTSVGPYVLQSLLMALERWLLELAEEHPRELDAVLLSILQRANSAMLTAVVASVATAFPRASGETLLVLLRSRVCIELDRQRLANESQAPSMLTDLMPRLNDRDRIYTAERKEADGLLHRRHDLETAILSLQSGPLAPRIHEILDRHRSEMPPLEEQDEYDRVWRLALHRMDLRQYTVAEDGWETPIAPEGRMSPTGGRQYVRLDLNAPEPDIREMLEQTTAQSEDVNARLGVLTWGMKVFNQEEGATCDPARWQQKLHEARSISVRAAGGEDRDLGMGGPAFVAAVCVRDHWEEMSGDERQWCVNVICSEVERDSDNWDRLARVQRCSMEGDRPSAWVLPLLLGKPLDDASRSRVRQALVVALTHAIDEVRWHVAWGVGRHLWVIDRELALRCVNALGLEAMLVQQTRAVAAGRPYSDRRQVDDIEAEAAYLIRQRFFEPGGIPPDAHRTFDPTEWFGAETSGRMLAILRQAATEPVAIAVFHRLATTLVQWWDEDDNYAQSPDREGPNRDYEVESALTELLIDFLLRTACTDATAIVEPIVAAIDRHPDKVHWILLGLISAEDRQPNTPQFWSLWKLFANKVRRASWLAEIDREYARGSETIPAIFLCTWWKEDVRHWRSLEGHERHVHALFEDLPASPRVLDAYVRFLYHIGDQSLPEAFARIADRLHAGDPGQMLREGDTIFMLEVLLQRYVYGRPAELKRQARLREAVLFLLDVLVESGSSAAFRMRDDFVTPVSAT